MSKGREVAVLMIEDDDVDRQALARAFVKMKISNDLIFANDGIEGLEILRRSNGEAKVERPFLIILDLNMPRMNGLEFLEELRNDEKLHDAVVFVLTTSSDEQDRIKAYNKNVAGYLVKGDLQGSFMKAVDMLEHYWRIVELPH